MFIESGNFKLKLEEFRKEGSISSLNTTETEKKVLWLVRQWLDGEETFTFHTSGSTGKPKEIKVSRQKIIDSTYFTFEHIDPKRELKSSLLCINPQFIGGAMVVLRALIMDLDLYISEPGGDIFENLPKGFKADLVSMVPLQYQSLHPDHWEQFKVILIGGAPMPVSESPGSRCTVYSTYGMTETVSHIALRKIDEANFQTVGDAEVSLDKDGCLQFQGTMTDHQLLTTNDLGELISPTSFRWIGRKDFVINSGGIKLNPEVIEEKLKDQLTSNFLISSLPDERLGEKVVLVVEESLSKPLDFEVLGKYERPKATFENHPLAFTASGKIDRKETRKQLIESQQA